MKSPLLNYVIKQLEPQAQAIINGIDDTGLQQRIIELCIGINEPIPTEPGEYMLSKDWRYNSVTKEIVSMEFLKYDIIEDKVTYGFAYYKTVEVHLKDGQEIPTFQEAKENKDNQYIFHPYYDCKKHGFANEQECRDKTTMVVVKDTDLSYDTLKTSRDNWIR